MHADDMKRLDELKALADNSDKRQKFLMESFGVARELGRHFEHMNGSPQLKRMANLVADWFALQAIGLQQLPASTLSPSSQRLVDLANNIPAEMKADIVIGPEAIAKALGLPIPPNPTSLAEAVAIARGNPEPPTMPIRFAGSAPPEGMVACPACAAMAGKPCNWCDGTRFVTLSVAANWHPSPEKMNQIAELVSAGLRDNCHTHCERGDGITCPDDECDIDTGLVKQNAAKAPAKKKPAPEPRDENLF